MEENDKHALTPLPEVRYRMGPRWNRIFTSAAVALLAVLSWQAYDSRQNITNLREDLELRTHEAEKAATEAQAVATQRQASIDALQARIVAVEAQLQEAQTQFATIDDLHAEIARTREERTLNEAGQAIDIASQQLQLAGNVPAALASLQTADARIALLDPARFLPVRKLLAQDIESLKALPLADVPRLALQLDALIGRLDKLPLAFERQLPELEKTKPAPHAKARKGRSAVAVSTPVAAASEVPSPGVLVGLLQDLWSEFRGLIRIERLDQPDPVLLAPEQASYLRANLRLRLLSARVALLQRQDALFADDVKLARSWVQRYFDTSAPLVASSLSELDAMSQVRLGAEMPDLDALQTALRNVKPVKAVRR